MIWLLQNTQFGEDEGEELFIEALKQHNQHVIPLDHLMWHLTIDMKVKGLDPTKLLPMGTKDFAWFGKLQGWNTFYGAGFDYMDVAAGYGSYMLNDDVQCAKIDDIEFIPEGKTWIRQNAGFNVVKGILISSYSWPDWRNGYKRKRKDIEFKYGEITGDTEFVWASPKKIFAEYRNFVVGRRVITSSQYYLNGEIVYKNTDDNEEVMSFAQKMVDHWSPSETFVIDLARREDGSLSVLETNCFNCSGYYFVDGRKIVKAIVDYYGI